MDPHFPATIVLRWWSASHALQRTSLSCGRLAPRNALPVASLFLSKCDVKRRMRRRRKRKKADCRKLRVATKALNYQCSAQFEFTAHKLLSRRTEQCDAVPMCRGLARALHCVTPRATVRVVCSHHPTRICGEPLWLTESSSRRVAVGTVRRGSITGAPFPLLSERSVHVKRTRRVGARRPFEINALPGHRDTDDS
eukprot:5618982-Pleurochrysis_carterae.AAC.1